jgi:hypothetical protein
VIKSPAQVLPSAAEPYLELDTAAIANPEDAKELLIQSLLGKDFEGKPIQDFAIIHVVRFKDPNPDKPDQPQALDKQNWYVFRDKTVEKWSNEDFSSRNRIYGVKELRFLYVYINVKPPISFTPLYDITVKAKNATNVQDLFTAAGLFLKTAEKDEGAGQKNYYGGGKLSLDYATADIVVTPTIPQVDGLKAVTFDNEGRAFWDVGIAVPIKQISQTTFNSSDNTVTANTITKTNVFAVLDGYIKKRDLKSSSFDPWPHPLAGISIRSQPLHRLLFGVGWGFYFAEFYVGAQVVKDAQLNGLAVGQPATPTQVAQAQTSGYTTQFAFGINMTVRAAASKLKSSK